MTHLARLMEVLHQRVMATGTGSAPQDRAVV